MTDDIIKRLREAIAAGPTPGPWVVYDDSNDGKTNRIEIVALGKTVARIYRSVPEEDLPNARLIAAASPDNIAALLDRLDKAERENERLRAERDEHARWREKLADDLHERESQIIDGWAALRASGVQSEKSIADGITFLRFMNLALAADARRYRWLRGREDGRYMTVYAFRTDIDEVCLGDELDSAIDAAMAAERGKE